MLPRYILYKGKQRPFLKGNCKIFTDTVPTLTKYGFMNMARSLKVEGNPWVAFDDESFRGNFKIFKEGDHTNLGTFAQCISSIQEITVCLENPEIVLYEHVNYYGKAVSIFEVTRDMKGTGLDDVVSSHKVKKGAWILYKNTGLRGTRMFTTENHPNHCYLGWNDQMSSLKPVTDEDCEKPQ
uniref:Beta/gamma crystallin 'Greek key' domain-containing protein n=1 Tax=Callorhinchus milii TaxID=7868 RepID=A0A4W3H2N0_CALMI